MSVQDTDVIRIIVLYHRRFLKNLLSEMSVDICGLPDQLGDGVGGGDHRVRGGREQSGGCWGRHGWGRLYGGWC